MRHLLLISALQVLAAAIPHPQAADDPLTSFSDVLPTATTAIPDSTSLNIPITAVPTTSDPDTEDGDGDGDIESDIESDIAIPISRSSKKPHHEPIPIFTRPCLCDLATVRYPCWATDPLQKCRFEESFSYACYMQAAGGCPKPTRSCSKLFQPTPLPPGAHPCELQPNNPHVPTTLPVLPPFPTFTGLPNVTLSWPTASAS